MRLDHLANAVVRAVLPFQPALRRLKRRFSPYEDDPGNSAFCITNGLDQLAALRRFGCGRAQGFHLGRPVDRDATRVLLRLPVHS